MATFRQLTNSLKIRLTGVPYAGNQIPMSQDKCGGRGSVCLKVLSDADQRQPHQQRGQPPTQAYNADQGDAKIDWNITQSDRLSARYSQAYQNDPQTNSLLILGNGFTHAPIHNAVGTWTHTLSPNILNEARFGASWITLLTGTTFNPSIGNLGTELGIANANTVGPGLLLLGFGGGRLRRVPETEHSPTLAAMWSTRISPTP